MSYIKGIPQKRFLPTLIRFDCAVVVYAVLGLAVGQRYSPLTYLLSLTGWESVGNSNWYMFDIMVLYLLTYLVFRLVCWKKQENYLLASTVMLIVVACGIVFLCFYYIKPTWWYDTVLCYVLGVIYSLHKDRIGKIINRNLLTWAAFLVVVWAVFAYFKMNQINIWFIMARNIVFCIAVTILTMRVLFKNKVLVWCGKHLFEIYILQRIPMILLKFFGLDQVNIYLYFAGCVVITLLLVYPFQYITERISNITKLLPHCHGNV